jgi:outer membrane lipoprotein-sorting protein
VDGKDVLQNPWLRLVRAETSPPNQAPTPLRCKTSRHFLALQAGNTRELPLTAMGSASTILGVPRRHPAALGNSFMRKFFLLSAIALLALSVSAQSADEIITKYIAARGGLAKIKALKSERISGTISFGPDGDGTFVVERERTLKLHTELSLNGQTLIRTYDGKTSGWIYNPFAGIPAVEAMSEAEIGNIAEEADFEGPFIDYKEKGNQVQFAGKEEVEGKPAYKLKLTNKSGEVRYFFFDVATGLLVKMLSTAKEGDKDVSIETYFRDYREVHGLKYPFLVESTSESTTQPRKIIATNIEVDVRIDQTRFGKPNPPAPADAPKPN